jgi:hypothetical protein
VWVVFSDNRLRSNVCIFSFFLQILAALTGVLRQGVNEVTIWACNALGNLATAGSNRICIIRSGGVAMLLEPCNSTDPQVSVEAARALVLLR